MDDNARKAALGMIPYGLNVMSAEDQDHCIPAGALNWITHASFKPPLVAVEVKADSQIHDITKTVRYFALNVLDKGQQGVAHTIFKPAERYCQSFSRETFLSNCTGGPVLDNTPAFVECSLSTTLEEGEYSIFIGEVGYAGLNKELDGRADDVTLLLKDLGGKIFGHCMDFII